ncbi:hypothetical protein [Motilibacter deserti]|uniref:Sensor histidine kinase n=1 Tax=Motilibacter deserti TaxID=2714956 RepID=A0ABX0GR15_9ACTN|nr:hypothetical protein [Motilibacter deserti]NHC12211.1 hypothetical protein [Motilibacter deserti]
MGNTFAVLPPRSRRILARWLLVLALAEVLVAGVGMWKAGWPFVAQFLLVTVCMTVAAALVAPPQAASRAQRPLT